MLKRTITLPALAWLLAVFTAVQAGAQSPGDTINVLQYDIQLDVLNLPAKVIHGRTGVVFHPNLSSIQSLTLELKQLTVDSVKQESGEALAFVHNGDRLHITLPEPLTLADTAELWVWYHGIPFAESWGGFHFAGTYAFNLGVGFQSIPHNLGKAWFPCVDDFQDRALYDYHIRVENANRAVCGGLLQSVTDNGDGTHTYNWHSDRTIPTYLASVAVGPYALVEDVFSGMEADIPMTYYVRPVDTNKVAGTFANLQAIASIYESQFGAYPFQRIGMTGTGLGAMEHAENIFLPHSSISGNTSSEWLYAHELSHMWFGDMVTCATDADMWMNEGWARWCEVLFTEHLYGQAAADAYYKPLLRDVLQYTHLVDGGYRALSPMPSDYTYGSTVYDKGAIVTHALRGYMGDSLFFQGVRDYLDEYGFSDADSYQLRDALSASSGIDLTGFFDFYVFNPGFTHYSVDSFRVMPKCGQYQTEVYLKQKLKGTSVYAEDCRVELTFMTADWQKETLQVNFTGVSDTVVVTLASQPLLVMADLYNRAGDATTDEAKTLNAVGTYDYLYTFCKVEVKEVIDSAYVRVTHNWVAPDSLMTPTPGLTLSTNRYWTVEGIFPTGVDNKGFGANGFGTSGFDATGVFNYNKNVLDGDIITGANDSIVMLYRSGAGEEWQSVEFTRVGPWQLGYIYVDHLQPGQYTLAIWDEAYVGTKHLPTGSMPLRIFPNPAEGKLQIQNAGNDTARLTIHRTDGRQVHECILKAGEQLHWPGAPGTYVVSMYEGREKVGSVKAILK